VAIQSCDCFDDTPERATEGGLLHDIQNRSPRAGIGAGRLRRTAPLMGLTARTAGEAIVVALQHKATGADTTEAMQARNGAATRRLITSHITHVRGLWVGRDEK
jgi:hypothetical protein